MGRGGDVMGRGGDVIGSFRHGRNVRDVWTVAMK